MPNVIIAEMVGATLQDDRLSDGDRNALFGAQQALRNILAPDVRETASQSVYRIGNRLIPPARPNIEGAIHV